MLDLAADPSLAQALQTARSTGEPRLSAPIRLERNGSLGFFAFVPVFARDLPLDTAAQRRDALLGVVVGALSANELAEAAFVGLPTGLDVRVTDGPAVLAVLDGPDGVLAGLAPGAVVVDCSTTGAEYARQAAALCRVAGVGFLDSPVSGSTAVAERGALGLMVGGEPDDLDRVRPVLERFGATIVDVGPAGAGAAVKVGVNGLLHTFSTALAESLVAAEAPKAVVLTSKAWGHEGGNGITGQIVAGTGANAPLAVAVTDRAIKVTLGTGAALRMPNPITGSEDFSRVIAAVPGAMLFLGAVVDDRDPLRAPSNHAPQAAFDDSVLAQGTALYATLAARRLAQV